MYKHLFSSCRNTDALNQSFIIWRASILPWIYMNLHSSIQKFVFHIMNCYIRPHTCKTCRNLIFSWY